MLHQQPTANAASGAVAAVASIGANPKKPVHKSIQYILDHLDQFIEIKLPSTAIPDSFGAEYTMQDLEALCTALETNKTVKKLHLAHHEELPEDFYLPFSKMLAVNTALESLELEEDTVGDDCVLSLVSGLANNRTLKELVLKRDNDAAVSISSRGVCYLAAWLAAKGCVLERLNLNGHVGIGNAGAVLLGTMLQTHSSLIALELDHVGMSDVGASELAAGLKANATSRLRVLSVARNYIGQQGALDFAAMLTIHQTLSFFDISHNRVDRCGMKALVKSIAATNRLETFRCAFNNFIHKFPIHTPLFAGMINPNLVELDISQTHLDDKGVVAIGAALKTNKSLTAINLQSRNIGTEGANALLDAMMHNTGIIRFRFIGEFGQHTEVNQLIQMRAKSNSFLNQNWRLALLYMSFLRANFTSAFRNSVMNLIPLVMQCVGTDDLDPTDPRFKKLLNINKFFDAKYVRAIIQGEIQSRGTAKVELVEDVKKQFNG